MNQCVHQFQCPNPMCQRSFDTQRGLSLHFRNQMNMFCNPSPQFRTEKEEALPFELASDDESNGDDSDEGVSDFGDASDEVPFACWSDDDSGSSDEFSDDASPVVYDDSSGFPEPPNVVESTGFGLAYTDAQYIETSLAKMMNDIQAPKSTYAMILKWAREAYTLGYNFVPRHGTKDSLVKSLQSQLHLEHFRPERVRIKLPGDSLEVDITRFNFVSGLHSLLNHPDLTGSLENLDVNPTNPFGKYASPDGLLGPVNSGTWYKNAYHTCIKDPTTDFLVPICFACDETKISGGGTAACWPLMFSTTLFNQKLRNQPIAWRPLGYIYDLTIEESDSMKAGQSSHLKYQRLHAIFEVILETLLDAQQPHALDNITLTLGGVTKCVNLKVPIAFIIGDMQGGDKICSCSPCYSNRMQRLCRKCNIKGSEADDPFVKCKRMIMSKIQKLVENGDFESLDQINQYHVKNAWFLMDYGGDKYGIFSAACVVEALHALENGLIKQCLQILFRDLLSKTGRIRLDKLVKEFLGWGRQHFLSAGTQKDMPRLLFKDGVSKLTDITAATNVGVMLAVVVLSMTTKGGHFFNVAIGAHKTQKMRYVFQQLLCYWVWLKKDFYWKAGDKKAKQAAKTAIQTMLSQLVQLWPRDRGNGWQTAKHHEQIHVPDDIDSLGAHQNIHTGPSEHNHIENVKKMAKMTQGRKSVMDWQIANRRADSYIFDLAYNAMRSKKPQAPQGEDHALLDGISSQSSKGAFLLTRSNNRVEASFQWTSATFAGRIPEQLSDYVRHYFSRYYMDEIDSLEIPFFTEYRRQGQVFRAHPNYRDSIGAWNDWVMFCWRKEQRPRRRNRSNHAVDVSHCDRDKDLDEFDYSPGKLLGFLKVDNQISCVVRPCVVTYTKSSVFTTKWELAYWDQKKKKNPMISLVSVDAIVRHCLMIPQDGPQGDIFHEVWERKLWADEFHT
jgi:hypothetical protein